MRKSVRLQRVEGGLIGFACGDALGATLEFLPKFGGIKTYGYLTEIIGGGFMNLKAGETTDDTDMTIAVAKGILDDPENPVKHMGKYFLEWYDTNPKDIGISCRETIRLYKRFKDWESASQTSHANCGFKSAGNGTLMRVLPIALYYYDKPELMVELSTKQSKLTHWDSEASDACEMYCGMIADILNSKKQLNKAELVKRNIFDDKYKQVFKMDYSDLNPSGYVVHTFQCVLWAFLNSNNYRDCVQKAINLCGDADTIGAIAGGLAGVYYGIKDVPKTWSSKLLLGDELTRLAEEISNK